MGCSAFVFGLGSMHCRLCLFIFFPIKPAMSSESCHVSLSISSKNARASEEDAISRLISRASRAWYLTISPRLQASVVQKMDSTIHRINLKPVDCAIGLLLLIRWIAIYPVDIHEQFMNNRGQIESLFPGYTGNEFSSNRVALLTGESCNDTQIGR